MEKLKSVIESAFEKRAELTPHHATTEIRQAIKEVMTSLDNGSLRVAEKKQGQWVTHTWIKKAVLLSFRIEENQLFTAGFTQFFDKVPLKFADLSEAQLAETGVRVVPPACARHGAFIAPNCILMPSYVNVGAYIDSGTLIDTWSTIGSCAQIGKNVHISGGVGIGGVLEPVQANPVIIEDHCFIGARSEIVEGVIVEEYSVISMGVFIGQSTPIYHREKDEVLYGRVPAGSVVVSGSLPSREGKCHLYCAVIVKQVDDKTRGKIGLNELLRSR